MLFCIRSSCLRTALAVKVRSNSRQLALRALSSAVQSSQVSAIDQRNIAPLEGGGGSLAELSERAGYLPKPEASEEPIKKGFRGGKALFLYFLCNAVPFTALLYYLREQRQSRIELSLLALPASADDVASEALRVIRTSAVCFLVQDGNAAGSALRVDPHRPEATAYVPPTQPLPLVPQLERNDITDLFESPAVSGLGFIYFAVSQKSAEGAAVIAGLRKAGLLYMSHTRGAYCSVSGQISVLSDPESKRRYWRPMWALSFPPPAPVAATTPSASAAAAQAATAATSEDIQPWMNSDYMLLRLAIDEVSLQSVVDGPQRWEARRVRRIANPREDGPKWILIAP